jgi:large subunit ribosomal protein L10
MRPEKASIVEDIVGRLNSSPFLFVADYTGLKVDQFAELRTRLYNVGARCHVVKNTFLRRAVSDAGLPELGELKGQNAIVTGDKDVAAAAKILKTFTAEFKKPTVRTGIVDKLVLSTEEISTIADLPSREVLLAQLLGLLNQPATMLVRILNEPASALARVLKAKADKEGGAPEEAPASETPAAEAPAAEAPAA